ncbi:hypothetical protein FRB97_006814 [Tulasnella sp. 331]|nr:hypothetical protein FRB97_006814 [Tulasnella sp. 331]
MNQKSQARGSSCGAKRDWIDFGTWVRRQRGAVTSPHHAAATATSATRPPRNDMENDTQENDSMATGEHGLGVKTNLKRLREVSVEPQTPNVCRYPRTIRLVTSVNPRAYHACFAPRSTHRHRQPQVESEDLTSEEPKERKAPATKKNRLQSVTEQEQESPPRSPPLNHDLRPNSPPEAMLAEQSQPSDVQQIRKKVHDLNWQEANGASPPQIHIQDEQMQEAHSADQPNASHAGEEVTPSPKPVNEDIVISNVEVEDKLAEPNGEGNKTPLAASSPVPVAVVPPTDDMALTDEDKGAIAASSDDTAVPEPVERPKTPSPRMKPIPIARPRGHASAVRRRGSDSPEREGGASDEENLAMSPSRKRKLFTRESTFGGAAGTEHEEHSKRLKDDESKTASEPSEVAMSAPRHPTPPVVAPSSQPAISTSVPKSSGFAGWSGASPFASMAGNAFSSAAKPIAPQPKPTGFGAFSGFMSTSSPFANVASSSTPLFGAPLPSPAVTTTTTTPAQPPSRNHTPEVTARPLSSHPNSPNRSRSPSSSSLNRKKSPSLGSTKVKPGAGWGTYNGGNAASFGDVKRHSPSPSLDATVSRQSTLLEAEAEGVDGAANGEIAGEKVQKTASWREMLGTTVDPSSDLKDSKKMIVEEIELTTGEEDEDTKHQVRAKLYQLDPSGSYKERGLGILKIKVRKTGEAGARLVMRAEAVHRLILNAALFRGMAVSTGPDPKYVKLTSLEDGKPVHYAIRV